MAELNGKANLMHSQDTCGSRTARLTSVVGEEAKTEGHNHITTFSMKFTENSQEFLVVLSTAFVLLSQELPIHSGLQKNLFRDEYI